MSFESSTAFIIEKDSETIFSSIINDENMTSNGSLSVKRDEKLVILEIGILSLIFILIVFGNLCVLIALQVRKLKMNRMYYFLLHLCIADLIAAFFNVIPQLAWEITHRFYGGNLLCKTIKYLQILGPYLSSYVLVMTAVDRYQAICYPLSNCAWTPSRSKLMISCAWIVSLLCCVPQTIIFSYQEIPGTDGIHDCWGTFHKPWGERIYVTWYAVSVFIIPFIILTFTHVHISREIWLNLHKKRKSFKVNRNKESISSNKRNDRLDCDSLNLSETSEQISGTRLLVTVGKSYRFKGKGQVEVSVEKDCGKEDYGPRTHSIHGLTRAKIKTVKITIVIIMCYIFCSSPFICVQLWANWWPNAQQSPIWNVKYYFYLFNVFR